MHRRLGVVVVALAISSACYGKKAVNTTAQGPYQIEPIVNGSFIVEPRSFKPFKVTVAPGSVNPRVEGTFTASGEQRHRGGAARSESVPELGEAEQVYGRVPKRPRHLRQTRHAAAAAGGNLLRLVNQPLLADLEQGRRRRHRPPL